MTAKNPIEALLTPNVPTGTLPSLTNPVVTNDDTRLPTSAQTTALASLALNTLAPLVEVADPGSGVAIPVTKNAYVGITIAASATETGTLAIPTFIGQRLILNADTVGSSGTRAVTSAQAINQAGNTIMTFNAARDYIELVAIKVGGALRWTVVANNGVALS